MWEGSLQGVGRGRPACRVHTGPEHRRPNGEVLAVDPCTTGALAREPARCSSRDAETRLYQQLPLPGAVIRYEILFTPNHHNHQKGMAVTNHRGDEENRIPRNEALLDRTVEQSYCAFRATLNEWHEPASSGSYCPGPQGRDKSQCKRIRTAHQEDTWIQALG